MKSFRILLLIAIAAIGYMGCTNPEKKEMQDQEGFLQVNGGKIWYKVRGGNGVPLLMLHGGPGFTSYYLTPLADSLANDRPVILFDQLGCGRSDKSPIPVSWICNTI